MHRWLQSTLEADGDVLVQNAYLDLSFEVIGALADYGVGGNAPAASSGR